MTHSQKNVLQFLSTNVNHTAKDGQVSSSPNKLAQRLQSLYSISEIGKESMPFHQLFSIFHRSLKPAIYAENILIALYNPERSHIHIPYFVDQADDELELTGFTPAREFIETTLVGYIFRRKQPMLADNQKLMRLKQSGAVTFRGTASQCWLGLPLIYQGEVMGVLALQSYDAQHNFSQDDLEFLQYASNPLAAVLGYQMTKASQQAYAEQLEDLIDWQLDELKQVGKKAVQLETFQKAEISPRSCKQKVTH